MVLFLFMVNKNLLIIYLYVPRQIIYLYHLKHHQVGDGVGGGNIEQSYCAIQNNKYWEVNFLTSIFQESHKKST